MDFNLKLLRAELARIDVVISWAVRRWQLAGQDPADAFRGLHLSDAEVGRLVSRPFGMSWGQTVTLSAEEEAAFKKAEAAAIEQVRQVVEAAWQAGEMTRLHYLAVAFDLSSFEYDAFLVCLAPSFDPRYERLYSYLQDDVTRKRPSADLILNLLASSDVERLELLPFFTDSGTLFKYCLVERAHDPYDTHFASQSLRPDKAVMTWLLGSYQPQASLSPFASLTHPEFDRTSQLLVANVWPDLETVIAEKEVPVLVFYGPDEASQEAAARLVAAKMGRPLLAVNIAKMIDPAQGGTPGYSALRSVLRDARLTSAIPYLHGWDACLADGILPTETLVDLCHHPDLVIVAGRRTWQAEGVERDRNLAWFDFPIPAYTDRLALWLHLLEQEPLAVLQSPGLSLPNAGEAGPAPDPQGQAADLAHLDIPTLAGQFILTNGQVRDVTATARDRARQRQRSLTSEDLFVAARAHSNPRLSSLARQIVPRYTWNDIVLPDDQIEILRELVATVRGRPIVLEEWGVGRKLTSSKGITILFAGEPGTGKTMAAEIIAGELGLDLYKIDLSSIVSKYIGETEKNLERIFSEAQQGNAILFFDEADAIFGKRSEVKDAHDRYANIEISYLLQRMEAYDGVTILATNLRSNLDEAFTRRLQFAVDFPFPDENDRLRIWQTLFPPGVPRQPDLDFGLLAHHFKLAGGNIRNIIVGAAYLAAANSGKVTMEHLLHSTRRELQKMGRLVNKAEIAKIGGK